MDVEGLRRRRGREPSAPQPALPLGVEDEARGQGVSGELGLSLNMCLLGALVLLGLGILLLSGEWRLPSWGPEPLARPFLSLCPSPHPAPSSEVSLGCSVSVLRWPLRGGER